MPTSPLPSFSQLRAFVSLCDHQHFGEAATTLGVSQPGDNTLWVLSPKSIGEMRSVEAKVMTAKPKAATNMPHAMRAGALTS